MSGDRLRGALPLYRGVVPARHPSHSCNNLALLICGEVYTSSQGIAPFLRDLDCRISLVLPAERLLHQLQVATLDECIQRTPHVIRLDITSFKLAKMVRSSCSGG